MAALMTKLRALLASLQAPRLGRKRPPARRRPWLEELEPRLAPATVQFSAASETINATTGTFSIPVTLTGTGTPQLRSRHGALGQRCFLRRRVVGRDSERRFALGTVDLFAGQFVLETQLLATSTSHKNRHGKLLRRRRCTRQGDWRRVHPEFTLAQEWEGILWFCDDVRCALRSDTPPHVSQFRQSAPVTSTDASRIRRTRVDTPECEDLSGAHLGGLRQTGKGRVLGTITGVLVGGEAPCHLTV
jgi:hypothetical protein